MDDPRLLQFRDLVLAKNEVLNLTAIRDPEQFYRKHILDSLACAQAWQGKDHPNHIIDVGTGAGFPGIVLAIAYPYCTVTLVESIQKKAQFLEEVTKKLSLSNIRVVNKRAEALHQDRHYLHQFDAAVSRAVAPLDTLIPLLEPFIKPAGMIIAMKGQKAEEEIFQAKQVLKYFQLRVEDYTLPGEEIPRKLVILTHELLTPYT